MSVPTRLRLANILIVIGCLAGMAICFRVWVGVGTWGRSFPTIEFVPGMPNFSAPWDVVLASIISVLLIGMVIWPQRRWLTLAVLLTAILLILGDLNRLQPWFYQYLMMLGVLALGRRRSPGDDRCTLGSLRLIIICIYMFSGLHKLNLTFAAESAPLMLKPLHWAIPEGWPVPWMGWAMAGTETLLGILLAWRRTRTLGVLLAAAMHVSILALIGPLGINYNHVVWPWNLIMIAMVWTLFWPRGASIAPVRSMLSKARQAQGVFHAPVPPHPPALLGRLSVIVLAAIVPIGGWFGWVDVYLSWGMYAGAPPLAAVRMNDEVIARLPADVAEHVQDLRTTGKSIVIMDWSFANLRVAYPEEHLYRAVAADLARYAELPGEMTLVVIHRPARWSTQRVVEEIPIEPADLTATHRDSIQPAAP